MNPAGLWWAAVPREDWGHPEGQRPDQQPEWHPRYGDRHQALVFIGQQMNEAAMRARLDACLLDEGLASRDIQDWAELPNPFPELQNVKEHCCRLAGVDLSTIDGVGVNTALTLLSEIGTDMSRWRSERAFGAWLGLAPNPRKSGGRVLRSKSSPGAHRAATALRLAARGVANSKSALGAFYRRLRARIGAPKALTATAYKIAKIIYRMLKSKRPYQDIGQAAYDERFRARRLRSLTRMARDLGYKIVPEPEAVG